MITTGQPSRWPLVVEDISFSPLTIHAVRDGGPLSQISPRISPAVKAKGELFTAKCKHAYCCEKH